MLISGTPRHPDSRDRSARHHLYESSEDDKDSRLSLALQKPIAEPLLHAMVPLSSLLHAVNWLNYQEGLTYLRNAESS